MAFVISRQTLSTAVGTEFRPRATIRDKATRAEMDLSTYSGSFAMRAADAETGYAIAPTAGTTDDAGHIDATITASAMSTLEPGRYVGEFLATLAGAASIRVQVPVVVNASVIE